MRVLAVANLTGLLASDIFEGCTPERIADIYEKRTSGDEPEDVTETEERERKKAHPLTPNQISIFDYWIFSPKTIMWNLPRLYRFSADTDAGRLCDALNRALANRTALYTVFEFNEECSLVQRIASEKILKVSVEKISEAEFSEKKETLLQPFRPIGEPLVHAGIWQTEEAVYLFFDVHHIMTDGLGMQLLNEDIVRAFKGEPLEPDTYYAYLYQQEQMRLGKKYAEDRAFFESRYGKDDWCINLVPDMMIVCYETADIMSGSSIGSIGGTRLDVQSHAPINSRSLAVQIIENKDGILPFLMFNQALYSDEKVGRTVELFSNLLDRILKTEDPETTLISQLLH